MSTSGRITLICPNLSCRRTLHVPLSSRGKVMRCAYCNSPFRVPENIKNESETVSAVREGKKE